MMGTSRRAAPWLILALIVAVALAARLSHLGAQPLWTDEALTVVTAGFEGWRLWLTPIDPTPGLYFTLHRWLFGSLSDPATVRLLSVAAGVGLVAGMFWLVRAVMSVEAALLAAAVTALSGPLIDYSQEARAYALLLLLLAVAARALIGWDEARRVADRDGRRWAWLFAATATLAAYTHLVGTIVLFCELSLVLGLAVIGRRRDRRELLVLMVPAVLVVPEILRLAGYAARGHGFDWLSPSGFAETAYDLVYLLSPAGLMKPDGLPNRAVPLDPFGYAGFLIAWIAITLMLRRGALRRWIAAHRVAAAVIALFLLLPWLLYAMGQLARPVLTIRTALPFLLGAIPLIALTVDLDTRRWRARAIAAVLIILPSAYGLERGAGRHEKEDWRRVVDLLKREGRPGDVVIGCSLVSFATLNAAAEARGGIALPMLISYGRGQLLAGRSIGASGWAARFREPLWLGFISGDEQAVIARAPTLAVPVRRLWVVYSACDAADRQRIDRLAIGGTTVTRWRIKDTIFHAVTGIDRIALARPIVLRVPAPRP